LGNYLILMDKETLIRLATPASIFVLALSIISVPIVTKAGLDGRGSWSTPIHIECVRGCY
jgi:hypothetical protein